jgi:hypothetical protein
MKDKKRLKEVRCGIIMPKVAESVKPYFTEKDVDKRVNFVFVQMLEGLSAMLAVFGNLECKGGGCIDPKDQLFHCKACTFNGIKHHVDQGIERWKERVK